MLVTFIGGKVSIVAATIVDSPQPNALGTVTTNDRINAEINIMTFRFCVVIYVPSLILNWQETKSRSS